MFTGIIEGLGELKASRSTGQGQRLCVEAGFDLTGTKIGDSIAVCGACLTAVTLSGRKFEADVAPETLSRTILGDLRIGAKVNLERALRFSDRLVGHLVTGHIDGTGTISSKKNLGNAVIVKLSLAPELGSCLVEKGSLAIDGISLTINSCAPDQVEVSIIPHTAEITTIGFKNPGDRVNIETDIIGKYIEHFLGIKSADQKQKNSDSGIDREFLAKAGFF